MALLLIRSLSRVEHLLASRETRKCSGSWYIVIVSVVSFYFDALLCLSTTLAILGTPLKGLQEQFVQAGVDSDDICDLLEEDPSVQGDEETKEEERILRIHEG